MSSIPFGNLLESLPNEILFEILGYLDVSSFFSVHCTSKFLFDTLYDLNCSKANNCCRKANFRLVKVLDTNRSLEHSENFRKYVFYNECYDLVRGTPHEFIVLNVAQLAKCDIQRLITKYKSLFRYNLLQICPISLDVSSIIVTYRFLRLFYLRENVNFKYILYVLRNLGFEADVNFGSIHEIRSLENHSSDLSDDFLLCNYLNANPVFDIRFSALRRYPSEITLRPRRINWWKSPH